MNRKRLATFFCLLGVALMGVDLLMTGNFFVHIGGLMAASILCFIVGLAIDWKATKSSDKTED